MGAKVPFLPDRLTNTERKVWNLAKFQVVQRRKKIGRNRRKRKLTEKQVVFNKTCFSVKKKEEGDRFGRDKKGKEKEKKNRPEKTEEKGSASTGERQHQQFSQVFPAGVPYLIRAA